MRKKQKGRNKSIKKKEKKDWKNKKLQHVLP
jgi:hypothetical protein